jgi:glutathione synthase
VTPEGTRARLGRVRILFVMDPVDRLAWDKDTSFAFMRAAQRGGHRIFHTELHQVSNRGREVAAQARELTVHDGAPWLSAGPPQRLEVASLDAVLIRKDPPFDVAYLRVTQQLDFVKQRVVVLNDPQGLRDANEKMFAFHFSEFMPRSLVSSNPKDLLDFMAEVGGKAVLKPLDGAGGSGVVVLTAGDTNCRSLADVWTEEGRRLALVQEYQPAVRIGDKRVLLLDGEPLGAILRVPRADDVRANIHAGGQVVPTELTPKESELVTAVASKLRAHGLWFVGLDLIGEKLIEVNVTSPTGIQELSRFVGRAVEDDVITWLERKSRSLQANAS